MKALFLTKNLDLIYEQLYSGLKLSSHDVKIEDLLDDINTDLMTPAWTCFDYKPEDIAKNAYAGLMHQGERLFRENALKEGGYEIIVSGFRKGTGSSRETAAQCEKFCGIKIVIAASFAPIHERNNINIGQLMGDHALLKRIESGEKIPFEEFYKRYDPITQLIVKSGGLLNFYQKIRSGELQVPLENYYKAPMTMAQKLVANKSCYGGIGIASVDGGYSHEFTSAQVHYFLQQEYGNDYQLKNPSHFAVFEDHIIYADQITKMHEHMPKIRALREMQRSFQQHSGVRDYGAKHGISPGICHEVAREEMVEPGDIIAATDSHTCMAGCLNAFAYGVGTTEYAALAYHGMTLLKAPESIRFELEGKLSENCTAKDVMLFILSNYAKHDATLNRAMEFGGSGLASLDMDERATLCNMATECSAKTGICEADEVTYSWIRKQRNISRDDAFRASSVSPDPNAYYAGGVHKIYLNELNPMVALPGDPTRGKVISELDEVKIDIAYGGSCTAGKYTDLDYYALVVNEAVNNGLVVPSTVKFFIQFGSKSVADYAKSQGYLELFDKAKVTVLSPGCGACIGCGPGITERTEQVTISAINRNFEGRSGPGRLYLASPLTVAASAFCGKICAYTPGMFIPPFEKGGNYSLIP